MIHTHNHTIYSQLDGLIKPEELAIYAKDNGQSAIAISDHGRLSAYYKFYKACKNNNVNPIIGTEMYFTDTYDDKGSPYHMCLYAINKAGFKQLNKLAYIAYKEGFYRKARISFEHLIKHCKGKDVICTTACVGGVMNYDKWQYIYNHFGDNFFIELQNHRIADEVKFVEWNNIAKNCGIKTIAANDAHYVNKADAAIHDSLLCISTKKLLADKDRFRFDSNEFYLKSESELESILSEILPLEDVKISIKNTELFNICDIKLDFTINIPSYNRRVFKTDNCAEADKALLRQEIKDGIKKNALFSTKEYSDRIDYELSVIEKMGFSGYLLIIKGILDEAIKYDLLTNVRGSAAGCLIAYVIGISRVNPIKHGLYFERFLNPDRISMPDIDVDLPECIRENVIEYLCNRYGQNNVARISNYGFMNYKSAAKDVLRIHDIHLTIANLFTKSMGDENKINDEAIKFANKNKIDHLIPSIEKCIGLIQKTGIHAAGVVISEKALTDITPLFYNNSKACTVTQLDMKDIEAIGLVKLDILIVDAVEIISKAVKSIKDRLNINIDLDTLPDCDEKTYKMLQDGSSICVFQFESDYLQKLLRMLKPSNIDELSDVTAICRPGASAHIDNYCTSKATKTYTYIDDRLDPILRSTHGQLIYQEQVMAISRALCGFSGGQADSLRKGIGKKDEKMINELKSKFIEGFISNGGDAKVGTEIFEWIHACSNYMFNKSHAVSYAYISYYAAYLKANYPLDYFMCQINSDIKSGDRDKLKTSLQEAIDIGLDVKLPNINEAKGECYISGDTLFIGLNAIKGISKAEDFLHFAPFNSITNWIKRVSATKCGAGKFEAMVQLGIFDIIHKNRSGILDYYEKYTFLKKRKSAKNTEALSLIKEDIPESSNKENVNYELDLIGVSLNNNLSKYRDKINKIKKTLRSDSLIGEIRNVKFYKKQSEMYFFNIYSNGSKEQCCIFNRDKAKSTFYKDNVVDGEVVVASFGNMFKDNKVINGIKNIKYI